MHCLSCPELTRRQKELKLRDRGAVNRFLISAGTARSLSPVQHWEASELAMRQNRQATFVLRQGAGVWGGWSGLYTPVVAPMPARGGGVQILSPAASGTYILGVAQKLKSTPAETASALDPEQSRNGSHHASLSRQWHGTYSCLLEA